MKKSICLLTFLLLSLSLLTGCSNNDGEEVQGTESTYTPYEYTFRDLPDPVYHEVADTFAGGDGTAQNPYQISTAEELTLLSKLLSDRETGKEYYEANYVLTTDIVLNDVSSEEWYLEENVYSWNPIGRGIEFEGIFDGNGFTIYGLYINTNHDGEKDTYDEEYGLFGALYGTVKNLNMENAYVSLSGNSANVGTIAGYMYFDAKIESCNVNAILESYDCHMGGIVGTMSNGILENCEFNGSITQIKENTSSILGGIVGYSHGDIINCMNYGNISYSATNIDCAGGIVGRTDEGQISNCRNEGRLSCAMDEEIGLTRAGGIAGLISISNIGGEDMSRGVTVINCQNNAVVEGSYRAGGIAGMVNNDNSSYGITIENCVNNGNIVARDIMGGVIGFITCDGKHTENYNICVKNCVNNTDLEGRMPGGIIGSFIPEKGKIVITGCNNIGDISGTDLYAAGIVAYMNVLFEPDFQVEISDCENIGAISSAKNAGGIIAFASTPFVHDRVNDSKIMVRDCTNSGEISTSGVGCLGGIFGCYGMPSIPTEISNCVNTGSLLVDTPASSTENEEAEVTFTLARCTGGIIGRVGAGLFLTTDTDKGDVQNVQKKDALFVISNCLNRGQLNVSVIDKSYTDFFGGIIGNASGEKEYSFFVEECSYMNFDRGLGNSDFPDVGEKVD